MRCSNCNKNFDYELAYFNTKRVCRKCYRDLKENNPNNIARRRRKYLMRNAWRVLKKSRNK